MKNQDQLKKELDREMESSEDIAKDVGQEIPARVMPGGWFVFAAVFVLLLLDGLFFAKESFLAVHVYSAMEAFGKLITELPTAATRIIVSLGVIGWFACLYFWRTNKAKPIAWALWIIPTVVLVVGFAHLLGTYFAAGVAILIGLIVLAGMGVLF